MDLNIDLKALYRILCDEDRDRMLDLMVEGVSDPAARPFVRNLVKEDYEEPRVPWQPPVRAAGGYGPVLSEEWQAAIARRPRGT